MLPPAALDSLDCENAFDLIALLVTAACAGQRASAPGPDAEAAARLAEARARLLETGAFAPSDFDDLNVHWCRLAAGTGMVTSPRQLFLSESISGMSADGVAEILAHELVHVRQFRALGARGFKCDYVRGYVACGGCQDRRHPLEREAYEVQDDVRARLLERALGSE